MKTTTKRTRPLALDTETVRALTPLTPLQLTHVPGAAVGSLHRSDPTTGSC